MSINNSLRSLSADNIDGVFAPKNYIKNGSFETGTTNGFGLGVIGTLTNGLPTGTPTLSGASGNLSITTVTGGNQLSGAYSLSLVSSAATTLGNCLFSNAYTIDNSDQAKVLSYKFNYQVASGAANVNMSGTSSNSFAVAAYDTSNLVWLPVTGAFNLVQSSGVGQASGTFQTGSGTGGVRLFVYFPNATAGAATLYLDDFFVGPQVSATAPAMTDFTSYTPTLTGFGTPTSVNFISRRVGDSLELQGYFATGTCTAVLAGISLGFNGANANVTTYSSYPSQQIVGTFTVGSSNLNGFTSYNILASPNSSTLNLGAIGSSTGGTGTINGNAIGNATTVTFYAKVKITGWSSNTAQSSDTDTRVVALNVSSSTTSVLATATTKVVCTTTAYDTHAGYSSGTYTVPVTGYYRVYGRTATAGVAITNTQQYGPIIYKNGSQATAADFTVTWSGGSVTNSLYNNIAWQGLLSANDTLDIRFYNGTSNTITLAASTELFLERLSGPAVVQATESVNASVTTSAGTSLTTSTITQVTWDTIKKDSHNAFNTSTNLYTVPSSGTYNIYGSLNLAASAATGELLALLYVNGSNVLTQGVGKSGTVSVATGIGYNFQYRANAGDTISIRAEQTFGGTVSLRGDSSQAGLCYFAILRVGN